MAEHRLNPKPGELWEHPASLQAYRIHSVTDDGWVRYHSDFGSIPLYTQPILDFIRKYRKASYGNE